MPKKSGDNLTSNIDCLCPRIKNYSKNIAK